MGKSPPEAPHTPDPAGPVRSSFFVDDLSDEPLGPGDCAGWYFLDGAYILDDPFYWPQYFVDDADGTKVEDVSAEPTPPDADDSQPIDELDDTGTQGDPDATTRHKWLESFGFVRDGSRRGYTHSLTPCPLCSSNDHGLFVRWSEGYSSASFLDGKTKERPFWLPSQQQCHDLLLRAGFTESKSWGVYNYKMTCSCGDGTHDLLAGWAGEPFPNLWCKPHGLHHFRKVDLAGIVQRSDISSDHDLPFEEPFDDDSDDDTPNPVTSINPATVQLAHVNQLQVKKKPTVIDNNFTVTEIVDAIRTSDKLRGQTEEARRIIAQHGRGDDYGDHKLTIPAFLPSSNAPAGTRAKGLEAVEHSGLYSFDLDEPRPVDIAAVSSALRGAPGVVAYGVSLGGDGMWCIAAGPLAEDESSHKLHWAAVAQQLPDIAKATSSGVSKNSNRFRVMAYDPDVWLAAEVTPLDGATDEELAKGAQKSKRKAERQARSKTADKDNYDLLTEYEIGLLGELEVPEDYNGWLSWLATLKACGFDVDGVESWAAKGPNYQAGEVGAKWDGLPDDFGPDARQRYRRAVGGTLTLLIYPSRDNLTDAANFHRLVHFNARRLVVALPEPTDPSEALADIYGIDRRGMLSSAEFVASVLRTGREYLARCYGLMDKAEFAQCASHARKLRDVGAPERLRQVAAGALGEQREYDAVPDALVVRTKADIDASLAVIGTPNGVLNLRTGQILAPSEARKHFVLSSTGVVYDPAAQHPKVDEILPHPAKLKEGSVELYRAKIIAYGMLNRPAREFIWEVCARGSGKSSFTNCLRQGLGDQYVRSVRREALQVPKYGNGASSHNGDLRHFASPARFVFVSEMRGNLDSDLLKRLTGGDNVDMRRIHREDETFEPTATLWIQGNPRDSRDAPSLGIADEDSEDAMAILDRAKMLARPTIPVDDQDTSVVLLSTPGIQGGGVGPNRAVLRRVRRAGLPRHHRITGAPAGRAEAAGDSIVEAGMVAQCLGAAG